MSSRVFRSCLAAVLAVPAATPHTLSPQPPSTVTDSAGVLIVESTQPHLAHRHRLATRHRGHPDHRRRVGRPQLHVPGRLAGVSHGRRDDRRGRPARQPDQPLRPCRRLHSQSRGQGRGSRRVPVPAARVGQGRHDSGLRRPEASDLRVRPRRRRAGDHSGGVGTGHGVCDRPHAIHRRSDSCVQCAVRWRAPGHGRRYRRRCLDFQPVFPRRPVHERGLRPARVFQVGARHAGAVSGRVPAVFPGRARARGRRRPHLRGKGRRAEHRTVEPRRDAVPSDPLGSSGAARYPPGRGGGTGRPIPTYPPTSSPPPGPATCARSRFPTESPCTGASLSMRSGTSGRSATGPPGRTTPSWYVFDEQGAWLGEVATPPGLHVFEIGIDYVLGRYRDEFDVQSVVMIPLNRGD